MIAITTSSSISVKPVRIEQRRRARHGVWPFAGKLCGESAAAGPMQRRAEPEFGLFRVSATIVRAMSNRRSRTSVFPTRGR